MKTDDVFLLHSANRAFLDGKNRLPVGMARPGTWVIGVLALFCTLSPPIIALLGLWEEHKFERLRKYGQKTVATVVHLHESLASSDSHDPDTYSVTYKYTVNSHEYEETAALDWFEYSSLSEGSRLEIRYDPGDPSVSKLEKRFREREIEGTSGIQFLFEYLVFMSVMGAIWLGIWYIRGLRPLLRLRREGRSVRGEVIDCSGRSGEDDYNVTLGYCFTAPDGQEIVDRAEAVRDDLKESALPAPGTPIMVYYVDHKTYAVL
jgi:hypothetical protein